MQGQGIEVPGSVAEEAVEPAPVAVANVTAGEDDVSDITATMGEDPARDNRRERYVSGVGEDGGEML